MTVHHCDPKDDLFQLNADALAIPVNCVGVMGAGLARVFAGRFPAVAKPYQYACQNGVIAVGRVHTITVQGIDLVCVPTKNHWRHYSKLDDVLAAIDSLAEECERRQWEVLGVPALGCGLGGLEWEPVKEALETAFLLSPTEVHIYPPRG